MVHGPPAGIFGFFAVDFLVLSGVTLLSRSTYRILDYFKAGQNQTGRYALIYEAGKGGQLVLREIIQNPKLGLRPLGFLDDDPALRGYTVNRISVLGSGKDLEQILLKYPQAILVLASARIEQSRLKKVLNVCQLHEVPIYRFGLQITPIDHLSSESDRRIFSPEMESVQGKPQIPIEPQRSREPVYD